MKKSLIICSIGIALLALLGISGHTRAATTCSLYVATTGSDTNPGTLAAPWKTVQKAANTALPGQTVCVRGGVYT